MSLSCSANNASRSGCTLPPRRLDDAIGGTLGVSLGSKSELLIGKFGLFIIGGERKSAIDPLDLTVQAACLEPVHGALECGIGHFVAQRFALQSLIGPRGGFIEPVGRVVGQ